MINLQRQILDEKIERLFPGQKSVILAGMDAALEGRLSDDEFWTIEGIKNYFHYPPRKEQIHIFIM